MVGIKQAVENAMTFARDNLGSVEFQLEEIESGRADGQDAWLVTLSMPNPSPGLSVLRDVTPRLYKVFAILKANGEVVSMKIRELAKI
jgi:hypothetical protein